MLQLEVNNEIILKSFNKDDAAELLNCIQRNTAHLQHWIPWIKPQSDLLQIEDFILEQIKNAEHQEGIMLGIFKNEKLIGMVGLQDWDHQLGIAELAKER
jgi:ribosomal-protein-serine acetyltransferase